MGENSGEFNSREVELDSHRELDYLLLQFQQLLFGHCLCDCSTQLLKQQLSTQVAWHWRGPHLLNVVVLALADGLFRRYGSERADELFMPPAPPFPVPSKPYVVGFCLFLFLFLVFCVCGRKAPYLLTYFFLLHLSATVVSVGIVFVTLFSVFDFVLSLQRLN